MKKGMLFIVRYLLVGVTGSACAAFTDYPTFENALRESDFAEVQAALQAGADANHKYDDDWRPLFFVANRTHEDGFFKEDEEIAAALISARADVNFKSKEIDTPLHTAVYAGYPSMVQFLLGKGAQTDLLDSQNDSLLAVASRQGNVAIVKALLDANAPLFIEGQKEGVLHAAVRSGRTSASITKLLLEKGADVRAVDKRGRTALHDAADYGWERDQEPTVAALLERNANPNSATTSPESGSTRVGDTPVHFAAEQGKTKILKLLLDKKGDVSKKNSEGDTPLHLAARKGKNEAVSVLLNANVDTSLTNESGETAAVTARAAGFEQIAKLIEGKSVQRRESTGTSGLTPRQKKALGAVGAAASAGVLAALYYRWKKWRKKRKGMQPEVRRRYFHNTRKVR